MCQRKVGDGGVRERSEEGCHALYNEDVEWKGEESDVTPLDDEAPRAMVHLERQEGKDNGLHAASCMGIDVEKSVDDEIENSQIEV